MIWDDPSETHANLGWVGEGGGGGGYAQSAPRPGDLAIEEFGESKAKSNSTPGMIRG